MLPLALILTLALALDGDPFRPLTFDQALAAATAEKKVVMIDFCTTCCPDCERIERGLWADESVRDWLAVHVVPIALDASIEKALAERYAASKFPTVVFTKVDGTLLGRIVGFRDVGAFVEDAEEALAGRDPSQRAKEQRKDGARGPTVRNRRAERPAPVPAPAIGGDPFRPLTFDQAMAAATAEKKVVMIDFFTTWCGPCKLLDQLTWTDEDVRAWLARKTIPLKIDAEKEQALAERFAVSSYPTIVFAKPDGGELARIIGFRGARQFLDDAVLALEGKDAVARAKEALAGHENDPMARATYADVLAEAGRNEEALVEYLWCFDHGLEHSFGYYGVRLSFLLGDIAELGERYPPALEALRVRRDRAEERLFASAPKKPFDSTRAQLASEAAALSDELEGPERTLDLYDRLKASGTLTPAVRTALRHRVLDTLIEEKRYADALESSTSPEAIVDDAIRMYRFTQAMGRGSVARQRARGEEEVDETFLDHTGDFMRTSTVEDGAHVYEALVGTAQAERAAKIAAKLIEFAPSGETYAVLIGRAARAGAPDAARALALLGLAKLPEAEHGAIRAALAAIASAEQDD